MTFQSIEHVIPYFALIVFIVIGVLIYRFEKKQRILRMLSKFEFKEVSKFRTNMPIKIYGRVSHVHEPFLAPYSQRKCVAYEFKIEQKKSTGKNSHWDTLVEEVDIQDFFIESRGEKVIIKPTKSPKNYYSYLVEDKSTRSGFLNDPSPRFQELLNQHSINAEHFFGVNKKLRYSERILEVGETVTVAGIATWKALDKPIPGYNYSKIAALSGNKDQKLIITDLPKAAPKKKHNV